MSKEPEPEPREPGGRNTRKPDEMPSEDLAAAYGHAARLRAHEVDYQLDLWLGNWMKDARDVLARRGHLERIREFLPFYFDPSRRQALFGPAASWSARRPSSGPSSLPSQYARSRRAEPCPAPMKSSGWHCTLPA